MTRRDWRDLLRTLPAAALLVVGLWAFCVLVLAFGEPPA